ncbi:MAG: hypothetical protein AAF541_18160 [Pseudomonadota bacterium]
MVSPNFQPGQLGPMTNCVAHPLAFPRPWHNFIELAADTKLLNYAQPLMVLIFGVIPGWCSWGLGDLV